MKMQHKHKDTTTYLCIGRKQILSTYFNDILESSKVILIYIIVFNSFSAVRYRRKFTYIFEFKITQLVMIAKRL